MYIHIFIKLTINKIEIGNIWTNSMSHVELLHAVQLIIISQ